VELSHARSKDTITKFGLFIWMIKCQIGIGILSLPSEIYGSANGYSWVSILVAGAVIQLLLFVYAKLYERMPGRILSEMTIELFGAFVGRTINIVYFSFFMFIAGYAISLFVQLVHTWLLPKTPEPIILTLISGAFLYLSLQTLSAIERFFTFASMLFVLILLFSLTSFTHDMHISYLSPVGSSGLSGILAGSQNTFFAMIGFEVVLFLFARVHRENGHNVRFVPTMTAANVFVTLFYAYFVVLCLVSFSPRALKLLKEPVLFLFKGLSFQLADRLDLIFLTIWIFAMTSIFVGYLYMASRSLSPRSHSHRKFVWIGSVIVYALGYGMEKADAMEIISVWVQYGYFFMIGILPALLLAISYLTKPKVNRGPQ
jgi:spore germination protein (amino acid permease)